MSVNAHISALQEEWQSMTPDFKAVEDRMDRTLVHRREMILSSPVADVLRYYPSLTADIQVRFYEKIFFNLIKLKLIFVKRFKIKCFEFARKIF